MPAPRSPAWQLAAERRTTACKLIRLDFIEHECYQKKGKCLPGGDGSVFEKEKSIKTCGDCEIFRKVGTGKKSENIANMPTILRICKLNDQVDEKNNSLQMSGQLRASVQMCWQPNVSLLGPIQGLGLVANLVKL